MELLNGIMQRLMPTLTYLKCLIKIYSLFPAFGELEVDEAHK
jgi:hypothetical protein